MKNSLRTTIYSLFLLALLAPAASWAQTDAGENPPAAESPAALSDEEVSAIALPLFSQLLSPYCPGASLRDCGSGQAEVLRNRIRDWIREGREPEWIESQLVSEFGENILGAPKFKGLGIIAYVAPVLALLIGLAIVLKFVESQKKKAAVPADEDAALQTPDGYDASEEMRQRVRQELEVTRRHSG